MTATLAWSDAALRLALALLSGALIGLERDERAHSAGLRTAVLVCTAACLAMLEANLLLVTTTASNAGGLFRLDPLRFPLGILSGIGFLGAGVILRRGEAIRGVTTAATIWATTVIGLCLGGGQIALGLAGTALALLTLWGLHWLETIIPLGRRGTITLTVAAPSPDEAALLAFLRAHGFALRQRHTTWSAPGTLTLDCAGWYRGKHPDWSRRLVADAASLPGITAVEWRDRD